MYPFDDQKECGSWCKHKADPARKCMSLPYGNPLSSDSLQECLKNLFVQYIQYNTNNTTISKTGIPEIDTGK